MHKVQKQNVVFYFLCLAIITLVLFNINQPFFWDKDILDSKQAHWFLANNFKLLLPNSIDPGHPPLMGLILAGLWFIFGQNLVIGHLFMLIIGLALLWEVNKICTRYFKKHFAYLILLLIMVETALLTQIVVISSDLLQAYFFVASVNLILKKKNNILVLTLIGLSLTNLRGMTSALALFIFYLYCNRLETKHKRVSLIKILFPFVVASIPSILFLAFHYYQKGWLVLNETGPWAGCYEKVNISGFIKNIAVFAWRMLDAGRIIIWGFLLILAFHFWQNKIKLSNSTRQLLILLMTLFVISLPSSLLSNMLIDNRYFLPQFITLYLLTGLLIQSSNFKLIIKKTYLFLGILSIFSGSFWVYPDHLSTCWSASLSHLPYHSLNHKMNQYIENEQLDKTTIGSYVPNVTQEKYRKLNNNPFTYHKVDFQNNNYIFYSNIYNISDEHLTELERNWFVRKRFDSGQVKVILYQNKEH